MKTNPNDPAFPRTDTNAEGLTKRELFAALALPDAVDADDAVKQADALIAALNKEAE